MRMIHTSDLHLGVSINGVSMLDEQKIVLGELTEAVHTQKIDAVIIAGDVFDHAVSSAEAVHLYNQTMTKLCIDLKTKVFMCAGNHDGAARLSSCGELLEKAGFYVAGSIKDGIKSIEIEDCVIHLLPFFSIDEVRYLHPDKEIKGYENAMRVMVEKIPLVQGKKNILAAHCYVTNAVPCESDRSVMIGGANMVSASVFEKFDYVALGHLHTPQDIGKNVRYSGSSLKLSFSEENNQKSFTIIDTDEFSRTYIPIKQQKNLRTIKDTYKKALLTAKNDPIKDDYMRIVLTDEYAHTQIQDVFRQIYANILSFSGKAFESEDGVPTLCIDEVTSLTPLQIMLSFFKEYSGEKPTEQQMKWFEQAVLATQKEEDKQ
ncbi:MAG: exonuclease SbcCD subunit D [Christensenellaceae bacterium]